MKVGLIFPNKDRRYKTVHLGMAYIVAYARQFHNDLSFQVLDTRVATRREVNNFFETKFDLIGMTVFSPVYFEVKEIFKKIKSFNSSIPIVLGGPYVTTIMDEIFEETPADYAVYGEGEITFNELLWYLKGRRNLDINGLMYRNNQGNIKVNPPRERITNLDVLPHPAYDTFPMERYPLHRLVTSRGCPFSCAWCNSSSIWKNGYRQMDARKMIAEVEFLLKNYGKKIFVFGDNSFNADLNRVEHFCDLLLEKNIDILWSVSLRADNITPEIARKMKDAGCYNVAIGVESANNDILSKIGKNTTIEKIQDGITTIKQAGIEIMSQYVIGNPFETLDNVKESIQFAKNSGCDYTNFYTVLPFKGTPQWQYVKQYGTLSTDKIHDFHSIDPRIVFETPEFSYEERLEAIRLVKKEGFYSNKDKKNWMFDFAKETSRKIKNSLPDGTGDRVYAMLKSIYKMKIVKKNNF